MGDDGQDRPEQQPVGRIKNPDHGFVQDKEAKIEQHHDAGRFTSETYAGAKI